MVCNHCSLRLNKSVGKYEEMLKLNSKLFFFLFKQMIVKIIFRCDKKKVSVLYVSSNLMFLYFVLNILYRLSCTFAWKFSNNLPIIAKPSRQFVKAVCESDIYAHVWVLEYPYSIFHEFPCCFSLLLYIRYGITS